MASSRKKVIVRRFSTGLLWGYLPPSGILQPGQPFALDLLDLSGRVTPILLSEVKQVSYVRDFNTADVHNPERLARKSFMARPRGEGLWIALTLRDGDRIEGLGPLDLSLTDHLVEDFGLFLIPPDIRGNTQRIFVPRSSIETLNILAVVTSPSQKKKLPLLEPQEPQPDLFSIHIPPGTRTQ